MQPPPRQLGGWMAGPAGSAERSHDGFGRQTHRSGALGAWERHGWSRPAHAQRTPLKLPVAATAAPARLVRRCGAGVARRCLRRSQCLQQVPGQAWQCVWGAGVGSRQHRRARGRRLRPRAATINHHRNGDWLVEAATITVTRRRGGVARAKAGETRRERAAQCGGRDGRRAAPQTQAIAGSRRSSKGRGTGW